MSPAVALEERIAWSVVRDAPGEVIDSQLSSALGAVGEGHREGRRYPYGWERAEDLAGLGVALVVWASAVFAGVESVRKLLSDQGTSHVGAGIAAAAVGIIGNQVVARYKLRVGRRIQSAP